MAKAMIKSQVLSYLTEHAGVPRQTGVQFFEALTELAYKEAKNGFTVPGLGKLVLMNRKPGMGRNPQTGAVINIAAKRVVTFRVANAAKDAVLGPR